MLCKYYTHILYSNVFYDTIFGVNIYIKELLKKNYQRTIMNCVSKQNEIKTKMVHEQWVLQKILF